MIKELIEYCRVQALLSVLSPTENTFWRTVTRRYSKMFHVPLPEVRKMNPEDVIMEVFEEQLDGVDHVEHIEDFLEQIYTLENPAYSVKKVENLDEFIKGAGAREENRLSRDKKSAEQNRDSMRSGKMSFSNLNPDNER